MHGAQLADKSGAFRTLVNVVRRGLKDKVANVYLTSLSMLQQAIDGFAASAGARDIQVRARWLHLGAPVVLQSAPCAARRCVLQPFPFVAALQPRAQAPALSAARDLALPSGGACARVTADAGAPTP